MDPSEAAQQHPEAFQEHYSEEKFWDKLKSSALAAGRKVVEKALTLYYTAASKETPLWAKGTILGALGYFIFPIDAIPDAIPVIGYTDDVAVMAGALATVAVYVDDDVREQAESVLRNWGFSPTPS